MQDLVGKDLGRYRITEQLGEGGMATVFKAYDNRLERSVAVKIIRSDVGLGDEMLKRFEREAKALAQLTHPNIVHINDYGEQGGMPYVVMDFLPGGTLKQKLGQPMAFADAARLLAPIARALEYAHQQKIVHRDVKPANILLTQSGAPMLSDFGIAKILEGPSRTELTATGAGIGTPDYMAPEQWMGKAEARTDIYALGIVFYELVTGRRPYTADTPAAILLKHVNDPLPSPRQFVRELPYQVEQVLNKALAKNLDDRFQTMGEFAEKLEQLASSPKTGGTRTVGAGIGGPTVLVQPGGGTSMKPPAAPPPPRPPTGSYPNTAGAAPAARPQTGSYAAGAARPQTGSYPAGAARPQTGPYPYTGAYPGTGAYPAPVAAAPNRNTQLVWLIMGVGVLVVLCLIGGVAGGVYLWQQSNAPLPTSAVPTVTTAASTLPVAAETKAGAETTPTPPPDAAATATPPGPTVPAILPIATGVGHTGGLAGVAYSPTGGSIASAGDDQTIRLWTDANVAFLLDLKGHTGAVLGVAFSPDGQKLASASADSTVRLWAPQSAQLLQTLSGHTAPVRSVAFSPDGRFLASGSEDGTVRLWHAGSGEFVRALRDASAAPDEQVWAVAFSPDAQTLLAGGTTTRLWGLAGPDDQPLRRMNVKSNGVAFSPDGRTYATASATLQLWDTASGQILRSLGAADTTEWTVAFSPDGQRVAAGSQKGEAYVWNYTSGELQYTFAGHLGDVNGVAFSPDGRFLATVSADQVVRLWQVRADPVPTFTPWPPSPTPTNTAVPPTRAPTRPPTRVPTAVPPTPVPPTPVPPTPVPATTVAPPPPTTPPPVITVKPILTIPIVKLTNIIILLPTATPTPAPIIIVKPQLTLPVIVVP